MTFKLLLWKYFSQAFFLALVGFFSIEAEAAPVVKPHIFTSGTAISAGEVNANYDKLYDAVNAGQPKIILTPGASSINVPPGVDTIVVEVIGAGGGGGSARTTPNMGNGGTGGPGGFGRGQFSVSPGQTVSINVGLGGAPGSVGSTCTDPANTGTIGGGTSVSLAGSFTISASGGTGGENGRLGAGVCGDGFKGLSGDSTGGFFSGSSTATAGSQGRGSGGSGGVSGGPGQMGKDGFAVITFY